MDKFLFFSRRIGVASSLKLPDNVEASEHWDCGLTLPLHLCEVEEVWTGTRLIVNVLLYPKLMQPISSVLTSESQALIPESCWCRRNSVLRVDVVTASEERICLKSRLVVRHGLYKSTW